MATNTRNSSQKGKYEKSKTSTKDAAMINHSTSTMSTAITNRRRIPKQTRRTKLIKMFKQIHIAINKKDVKWYWDIKKWSPAILITAIVLYVIGFNNGKTNQIEIQKAMPAETIYIEITQPTVPEETEIILDEEAVALAVLADSSASGRSDEVKRILMWVAINRSEDRSNGYGDSLIEEINKPKQWQEYDPESMYLQSTYDIALDVLTTWRNNGPRPIYNDMLWSVYNSDGSITVRNRFNDDRGRVEQTFG